MQIELERVVDDRVLQQVLKHCWGASRLPAADRLYACSDSILEVPEWYAFCTAPRSVAMQIETHKKKHGCYVWMQSARPDLASEQFSAGYSREQPVKFVLKLTARGMKEMAHYRMCGKAELETRKFMELLKSKVAEQCPELAEQMVPMCVYRNGLCTELHSCGYNKNINKENHEQENR